MEWKTVSRGGVVTLERFLSLREPEGVGISDYVRRRYLDRRLKQGGRCFFLPGEAVVFQGPGGYFSSVGLGGIAPPERQGQMIRDLRRASGMFVRPHSMLGYTPDVELFEQGFVVKPTHSIDYQLLALDHLRMPPTDPPPLSGLAASHPTTEDWERLLPLQMAYEAEEVLLPGRDPNPAHSRASLLRSLKTQRVVVATLNGNVVARVATNARGFRTDQIGGVYTDPALRRRGISRWLMTVLLTELRAAGRDASLFVKTTNERALGLYHSLGFSFVSPFRISYYQ